MPLGSMVKYFQDQGGQDHGGDLTWPGTPDGYPVRGPAAVLKSHEVEGIEHALDYHSEFFQLNDEAQKQRFDKVMDRIVNGWYMQHKRHDFGSPLDKNYTVLLEWVQIYGEVPTGKHPGISDAKPVQTVPASEPFQPVPPQTGGNRIGLTDLRSQAYSGQPVGGQGAGYTSATQPTRHWGC